MKILHLVQKPQLRGAEIFASQLASQINRLGHEAIIVYLFPGNANLPFNNKTISLKGNPKRRMWNIRAWKKLAQIIKDERPDIIQANAGDTLKYAVFSKLIFRWKQPIVFRNASTISLYIKTGFARNWHGLFFRFAKKVISVSTSSADDFARLFPQYKEKIVPIPIGIDAKTMPGRTSGTNNGVKDSDPQGPILIHVGGFTFEKNHIGLINILELILVKRPLTTLHLIGDGPLKNQIENLVKQKGLSSRVKFFGFQIEPMDFIRNSDVLLLPSLIEGLPGVILEAFYCKTPVVAYDVGGIKEILINNETGRRIERGDEYAFANAIIEALDNNTYNQRLVENAYQLVMSKYLNRHVAKQFLKVYDTVLS